MKALLKVAAAQPKVSLLERVGRSLSVPSAWHTAQTANEKRRTKLLEMDEKMLQRAAKRRAKLRALKGGAQ